MNTKSFEKSPLNSNKKGEILHVATEAWVQYFELLDDDGYLGLPASALNRFWEISLLGSEVIERSGKIGTQGKINKSKVFKSEELAQQYVEKMIGEKKWGKDYTDKSDQLYQASAKLAVIVGADPLTVHEAMDAVGAYLKERGLIEKALVTSDETLLSLTGVATFKWYREHDAVRENLVYIPGSFRCPEPQRSIVSESGQLKPERQFAHIHLDRNQLLKGPYQINLDLRGKNIKSIVFLHMPDAFKKAAAEGRPPQPNISIANDHVLEVLHFPSDAIGIDYAVIENLPNLREIHIGPATDDGNSFDFLRWLILSNLPRLESITVAGGLRWLDIDGVAKLRHADVRNAQSLDHFAISKAPALGDLRIEGCVKLREVVGMSKSDEARLLVKQQIASTQSASKLDGLLYLDMTFTDVDHVMKIINQGVKLATVAGKLDPDFCYGQELNPDFNRFSFRLLRPLEHVYTGGTGEIYAYEAIGYDFSKKHGLGIASSMGCSSQEQCLDNALQTVVDLSVDVPPGHQKDSAAVLKYLHDFCGRKPGALR